MPPPPSTAAQLHETAQGFQYRQIRVTPRAEANRADAPSPEPLRPAHGPRMHLTPQQWRLVRIGALSLSGLSIIIGFASMTNAFLDLYWGLTGPIEYRAKFQALALVSALTATLAWSSAAFISHRILFKK